MPAPTVPIPIVKSSLITTSLFLGLFSGPCLGPCLEADVASAGTDPPRPWRPGPHTTSRRGSGHGPGPWAGSTDGPRTGGQDRRSSGVRLCLPAVRGSVGSGCSPARIGHVAGVEVVLLLGDAPGFVDIEPVGDAQHDGRIEAHLD